MLKIRLSRGGRTGVPFYRILVTNSTSPRDSKFLEKLGTYNPLVADDEKKISINKERIEYWLSVGAQPTEKVAKFLISLGVKGAEKYKPDFAFSTWIFKIATNNCIDFIRKKRLNVVSLQSLTEEYRNDRQLQVISDILNPEETSIKKEESEKLKNILEHLPQRYRTLIILKYYDEKSYEEISQQLDLPLGTVKAQLSRARELMSNIMNLNNKNLRSDF